MDSRTSLPLLFDDKVSEGGGTQNNISQNNISQNKISQNNISQDKISETKTAELQKLALKVDACKKCLLCNDRKNAVLGEGAISPELLIVGEAPGFFEDQQKRPFVGRSGKLLDHLIETCLNMKREDLYIANVVKCRPKDNRTPTKIEINSCLVYLNKQVELLNPKLILTLGNTAFRALVDTDLGITKARNNLYSYRNITLVPTFHPSAALRGGKSVVDLMEVDFKKVRSILG